MVHYPSSLRVRGDLVNAGKLRGTKRRPHASHAYSAAESDVLVDRAPATVAKAPDWHFVKVADNLYRRSTSPYLYIRWRHGRRSYFKSTHVSSIKEAKRIRDEFLLRIRYSAQSRDEGLSYLELRQLYIDHCRLLDRKATLHSFLKTRAKHLDPYFSNQRAVDIIHGGEIGHYMVSRKREGASHASINREVQMLGQMFRLAASDEHRMLSPSFVPRIKKLKEPPPRQNIVTEKQYTEIMRQLPDWARPPIAAMNMTGWRVRAILSRRKSDVDLESGFLMLDGRSSKNGTAYKWPLVGELRRLVGRQLNRIVKEERKKRQVIPWLFHRDGKRIPYYTLYEHWKVAAAAAGYPDKLMHDLRRTAATRVDSTPGISVSIAMRLLGLKSEIMLRRYIPRNDDRLIAAAKLVSEKLPICPP